MGKLINLYPDYMWIPIANMDVESVVGMLSLGKVYVDFGKHPGKDRIPREAAIRGCCIITNRKGAAANAEDVSIPEEYKFANPEESFSEIMLLIDDILQHYPEHFRNFGKYRSKIRREKEEFMNQVQRMAQNILGADQ